jgi:CheY-like chemotaxis protein
MKRSVVFHPVARICFCSSCSPHINHESKKILVVDDDMVILKVLAFKLKGKGYDVYTATDGAQAVSTVRTQKPDLIILDLTFPPQVAGVAWDGFVIMDWLKRVDEAKNIPVIVVTGGDPAKYEAKARAAGATAFFHKPLDSEELLGVVQKTLDSGDALGKPA